MSRIVRIHELGGPDVLKLEDVTVPHPAPGEVRIAVKAIGLNRAESMFRTGFYDEQPVFPARLGYEAAGVIEAVGENVHGLSVGDAVSVIPPSSISRWGTYGELANVPAEYVVKHHASLNWGEAASLLPQLSLSIRFRPCQKRGRNTRIRKCLRLSAVAPRHESAAHRTCAGIRG